MNDRVYKIYPHSLDEFRVAIEREIRRISREELQKVFKYFRRRPNICLTAKGGHFQHLLGLNKRYLFFICSKDIPL
ncbi:hypothetical protein C0J52_21332 [Blattella germanica]|nr:hypothetical protein C0J52_21332 [Blattella germanica]